jgi:DNA-binding transcriptional LysR family regulator
MNYRTKAEYYIQGITKGFIEASEVIAWADEVIVAASKKSTKRDGTPWRLRDLAGDGWFLNPPGCGCRAALVKAFDRQQLPVQIAAEVFGEDLQLSLLAQSGGLGLVPRRQFEHSAHRHELQILDVLDFTLSATISLIRNAASGRLDPAIDLLVSELTAKLQQET